MEDPEKIKFLVDPRHVPTPLPNANSYAPFQLSTQTGTVIIDLTTTDGLFIFMPSWAEKVMGWYYPMDPSTQTFGTPIRLDYNIDIDQYYEAYRVISALFTVVGNTTSTTLAAFSGNMSGVEAYNSLANLLGNGTSVYQVYSYANLLGLTADPLRKEGAVPAYEGIGAFFINNPRRPWSRLEDSVPYAPSSVVNSNNSFLKFVDNSDTYSLHGRVAFNVPPLTLTGTASYTFTSGDILLDMMRASSINWSFATSFTSSSSSGYFGWKISYEFFDIGDNVINQGSLWESREGPTITSLVSFSRSGSFPTLFNTDEANLLPPARKVVFTLRVYAQSGNPTLTFNSDVDLNLEIPVYNGMRDGVVQSPILIAHSGNEIGTKLSVSGRLNLEARMNSEVNKFTQVRYRDVSTQYERALMKIAANPGKYGLKYLFRLSKLDSLMSSWDSALQASVIKHVDEKVKMLLRLYENCCDDLDKAPNHMRAEAATKATKVLRKIGKKLKGVSKEVAERVLKPAAQEALQLGKQTLHAGINSLLGASGFYMPPMANYNNRIVGSAATGFLRPGPTYQAATRLAPPSYKEKEKTSTEKDETSFKEVKDSPEEEITLTKKQVTLFPVLFVDDTGDLVESSDTVVGLFAIAPSTAMPARPLTVRSRIKNHWIENYTCTGECPIVTPIDPRENVTLLKVKQINADSFTLVRPSFPVTGRSIDLALWAYNNKIGNGLVFSSQVDNGVIQQMDAEVAVLKRSFAAQNRLVIVGNFTPMSMHDRCISVKTLPEMVRLLSAKSLIEQPTLLRRGWYYAMQKYAVHDLEHRRITYDGHDIFFSGEEDIRVPQRSERVENGWKIALKFGERYKLEKFFASLCEEELDPVVFGDDPDYAVMGIAATRVSRTLSYTPKSHPTVKASAAITLTSAEDLKAISKLISAGVEIPALWRALTLSGLSTFNPQNSAKSIEMSLANDKINLEGLSTQPLRNRANKRQFLLSKAVKVTVDGQVKDVQFPYDLRVYRQLVSDPELVPNLTSEADKAIAWFTFKYCPFDPSSRTTKQNFTQINEYLTKEADNFLPLFTTQYGTLTQSQLAEVERLTKAQQRPRRRRGGRQTE